MSKTTTPKAKKTACRECDAPTNYAVCANCNWAVCGKHAKKRRATYFVEGRYVVAAKDSPVTHSVCPSCAEEGF